MQYNRVEICGVNTSDLKVLTEKEKIELLKKYKDGDLTARQKLVEGNLKLILSVIQRFTNRCSDPDDLFQVGCIGLMKAIDNFDISLNLRFSTYAVPMIIGEVRRYLRDYTPIRVSRSLRDTAYHAMQVKEKIQNETGRDATIEEIAKELDLKPCDVVVALESIVEPISLHEPVFNDGGDTIYVMDQVGSSEDDEDWLNEICIKETVANLGDREKQIMYLRFLQGKTQTEVAREIGISQAQVSRLEKNVIKRIKES